jgi:hypothetical protein
MKEQILKLRSEGKTYDEIRTIVNCSKGTISYHCGEGQKEKYKQNNRNRKKRDRDWIDDIKKSFKCLYCTESRFWVLEFHHRDPSIKDKAVADMLITASRERVIKEIEKCDVICANCHKDLHYQERLIKD